MLRRALLAVLAFAAVAAAPALTLGARAEKHVREGHFAEGRHSRGKSLFLPGTDLRKLLKAAENAKPRREANGRDKRVVDAGVPIGSDGRSGRTVKTYVVIAEPGGEVVTMYPGR
jgi:hypothetical protein